MFCHQCGSPVIQGAKFCAKCGVSLQAIAQTGPLPELETAVAEPPAQMVRATLNQKPSALAKRSTRLGAAVLDIFIFVAALIPGLIVLSASDTDTGKGFGAALIVLGWLGLMVVQVVFLVRHGQSLGKRVLNIRIVRVSDEQIPGFLKVVLLRVWLPSLVGGIPVVGGILCLVDALFIFRDDKRCLHDLIAETKVIEA